MSFVSVSPEFPVGVSFNPGGAKPSPEVLLSEHDAVIRQLSQGRLASAIIMLTNYPNLRLRIHGQADSLCSPDTNLTLSKKRAEVVRDYLVAQGIEPARIETKGHGATQSLEGGNCKQGNRPQDRWVEFELIRYLALV